MALPRRTTAQGHELQFGVNHLGHMALTQALPLLQNQPDPRVVTVTSGAQYFGKIRCTTPAGARATTAMAPMASKLANVMFALELDARLREQGSPIRPWPPIPASRANCNPPRRQRRQPFRGSGLPADDPCSKASAWVPCSSCMPPRGDGAGWRALRPWQFGGLRGAPALCRVAPAASQPAERQRLWSLSEELLSA